VSGSGGRVAVLKLMRPLELYRLRDPLMWANASQLAKTVIAAVVAWVVAVHVFHLAQAFMAPWAAVLTVQATVFGSLRGGAQQAAASVVGVLIAFAAGQLFGLDALSLGLAVLVGLAIGAVPGLRAQGTTAATTAIVVLTTGYSANDHMLAARLADTGIGIAVALLINLVVWPPLRDRGAARQIDAIDDRVGDLLKEIAEHIRRGFTADSPTEMSTAGLPAPPSSRMMSIALGVFSVRHARAHG
jgi:uncharacterized membrane protein YgaE (UPF0421/DUF939 family)